MKYSVFSIVSPILLLCALVVPMGAHAQTVISSTSGAASSTVNRAARIPILIYHSVRPYYPGITNLVKEFTVPPDIFDEQMKYLLDNGFTPVTFDDVSNYFSNGTSLPARPVMVTIDDGWENQYVYAYPILKKYNIKAVFYVYPGAVGVKHFLTWTELQEMARGGMEIEDHTQTHPQLPTIKDSAALQKEIVGSRDILEKKLGITVKDFAYPFGAYNDQDVSVVAHAGYRTARTVHPGLVADGSAPYTIDGIIITGDFNRFVSWVNK